MQRYLISLIKGNYFGWCKCLATINFISAVIYLGGALGVCFNIEESKRNAQNNLVCLVVLYIMDWLFRLLLRCYQRTARE